MDDFVVVVFFVVGAVHLLPVAGVAGASALERLYGIDPSNSPDVLLLLPHRAVLFGVFGALLLYAIFREEPVRAGS